MRYLVVLLTLVTVLALAYIDAAVMIYTKVKVDIVISDIVSQRVFINDKMTEEKLYKRERVLDSIELWIVGSGSTIFSGRVKDDGQTLVLTNFHVIEYAIVKRDKLVISDLAIFVGRYEKGRLEAFDFTKYPNAYFRIVACDGPYVLFAWSFKRTNQLVYEVKAEVDKYDILLDVAILKLKNVTGLPCVKLAKSIEDYPIGQDIYIFGAPLGIPFQLTKGVLGQKHLNIDPEWADMLRYDCPQSPGSSGSGIYSYSDNKLIGIVRGSFVNWVGASYPGQHLGISIDNIRDWMKLNGYEFLLGE